MWRTIVGWVSATSARNPTIHGKAKVLGYGGKWPPNPTYAAVAALQVWLSAMGFAPAAAQGSPELVFDVRIERGRVAPAMTLIRVTQGDAVRLRWTSDRPIILHLHGYDIESKVAPGSVTEMAFIARATGRFPVEEHNPHAQGGHAHGEALVRIEVHPR